MRERFSICGQHGTAHFSRREVIQVLTGGAVGIGWSRRIFGQQASSAVQGLMPLNRFPRMMQESIGAKVAESEGRSIARLAGLKTKEDAEAHVKATRARIAECFGTFPERTPLKPRVTKVVEREAYKIETVIFESRPGFLVTANLYVPKGKKFPLPGVVGSCGHSANGKAAAGKSRSIPRSPPRCPEASFRAVSMPTGRLAPRHGISCLKT